MENSGYIYVHCPKCYYRNRVLVTFPAWNKPFDTRDVECECCKTVFVITDPNVFDENGKLIYTDLVQTVIKN